RPREQRGELRPQGERRRLGVQRPRALALERVDLDLESLGLDREDLVEDEGLGELREARDEVADARPRRARRGPARPAHPPRPRGAGARGGARPRARECSAGAPPQALAGFVANRGAAKAGRRSRSARRIARSSASAVSRSLSKVISWCGKLAIP